MTEVAFKKLERACAALVRGRRFPANTGGLVDVESAEALGQCKLVQECSLAELTRLVVQIETVARNATPPKRGVLFVKLREGRGRPTPILAVVNATRWFTEQKEETP